MTDGELFAVQTLTNVQAPHSTGVNKSAQTPTVHTRAHATLAILFKVMDDLAQVNVLVPFSGVVI